MGNIQFKIILRSLWRDRAYTTISILSLVIGLTCSVLLVGFVMNEFRIARSVPDSGDLYLLREKNAFDNKESAMSNSNGSGDLAPKIFQGIPGVEDYCVFHTPSMRMETDDESIINKECYEVTPSFAGLFKPVILAGNLKNTLAAEGEIAVTRSFALARFGSEKPIGEKLKFSAWKYNPDTGQQIEEMKIFTVTSVIDDREKGFMLYDMLVGLPYEQIDPELKTRGWSGYYHSFLKLNRKNTKEDIVSRMNDSLFMGNNRIRSRLDLLPVDDVYFTAVSRATMLASRDKSLLYIGGSVALAILAVACFNYINIGMVKSLRRLRCTSQQLAFGASGKQVMVQLIVETGLQMLLSLGIALLLIYRLLPGFNGFMGASLSLPDIFSGYSLLVLVVLLAFVTFLPSLYIFSKLKASSLGELLKREHRGKAKLVAGLVVAQFAISAVLLIWVLNIQQQMYFVTHARGDSERILSVGGYYGEKYRDAWFDLEKQLLAMPEVENFTYGSILSQGALASGGQHAVTLDIDIRFFDLFGIRAKQGKLFDEAGTGNEIVVNEALLKSFGIEDPIGYDLRFNGNNKIIGVVEDFMLDNSSREISPAIFRLSAYRAGGLILKIREGMEASAFSKIRMLLKKNMPDMPLEFKTMEQVYLDLHKEEYKMTRIIVIFTWISFMLTCIGLFGLAWYSVKNRRKEISLRKINGATGREIVLLLCGRFAGWILIAFAFAVPAGSLLSAWWLEQFVYRVDVSAWVFFVAFFLMLAVGITTVIWQSWRAASENPADNLKQE